MKLTIQKFRSWADVDQASATIWQTRTDVERLAAVQFLVKQLTWIKPQTYAQSLPSLYPIVKRRIR